jgi:hypothetical protein
MPSVSNTSGRCDGARASRATDGPKTTPTLKPPRQYLGTEQGASARLCYRLTSPCAGRARDGN